MQLFKKVLGLGGSDLKSVAERTKIEGTLYRVIKDTRNIMYHPHNPDLQPAQSPSNAMTNNLSPSPTMKAQTTPKSTPFQSTNK
jgi:hypothetical protein